MESNCNKTTQKFSLLNALKKLYYKKLKCEFYCIFYPNVRSGFI